MAFGEAERLAELIKREKELRLELDGVNVEIKDIKLQMAESEYGVNIGSIVIYKGHEFKVTAIHPWKSFANDKPWVKGLPKKKNGEFGKAAHDLYGLWSIKEPT